MQPTTKPRYISNIPLGKDLYDGQPQDKVAGIIASLIKDEDSFKLIGLDGIWGAGKSNLIKILEAKLPQHHFFIYDAWSHQEDLPRRAFLEELTADLIAHNEFNSPSFEKTLEDGTSIKTTWKEELDMLLAKRKITKTKTIPKVGSAYFIILIALASLPFTKSWADLKATPDAYKPWITIAPILLILALWGIVAIFFKRYRNLAALFALYKGNELEKIVNETVSESEPSVRQFRDWLTEVSEDLLHPIVVVFDNMDRMPAEKVKELWSAIQTFFSEAKSSYPKIRFIVPFDRNHISKALGEADSPSGKDDETNDYISTHFINKTFPVVFNVAPPPLTGWKGFFAIKFKEAFGFDAGEEYQTIESIYDLYHDEITPRSMIQFINEMVTLKLLWDDKIEMRYLALFVVARKKIMSDPLPQIISREFAAKANIFFKSDDDLPKIIAALVYNVPLEKASQVALYRDIQVAFRDKDNDKVTQLAMHPDFFSVLRQVIKGNDASIGDSVLALAALEGDGKDEKVVNELKSLWPMLANKQISNTLSLVGFEPFYGVLIEKLVNNNGLKPFVLYLIHQFHGVNTTDGAGYFVTLQKLEELLNQHKIVPEFLDLIPPKAQVNDEYFLSYVGAAKADYLKYKVTASPVSLDQTLIQRLSGVLSLEIAESVKYFSANYPLPRFEEELESQLESDNIKDNNILSVAIAYKGLNKPRPVAVQYTDKRVMAILASDTTEDELRYEAAAMRLAKLKTNKIDGYETMGILDVDDDEFVNEVSGRILDYINADDFIIGTVRWNRALPRAVAKQLIKTPTADVIVKVIPLLKNFGPICEALNVSEAELFNALTVWTKREENNIDEHNFHITIPDLDLLKDAIAHKENSFANTLIEKAKLFVDIAQTENWTDTFGNGDSYLFNLLEVLLESNLIEQLPGNALPALKAVLKAMADSSQEIVEPQTWLLFYDHTDKSGLTPTILDIRDAFINERSVTEENFVFFERMLREIGQLDKRVDDVVRTILKPMIQETGSMELILQQHAYYISLLMKAPRNVLADLLDVIREDIRNNTATDNLISFHKLLNDALAGAITILQATYMTPDGKKSKDVTGKVKHLVEQEHQLFRMIENDIVDEDPEHGTVKKLEVKYTFNGEEIISAWNEHSYWQFPS